MDFKFNFASPQEEDMQDDHMNLAYNNQNNQNNHNQHNEGIRILPEAVEISPNDVIVAADAAAPSVKFSGFAIKHVTVTKTQVHQQNTILSSTIAHSDIEKGFYEGGFQVWECSLDMVNYLHEQPQSFFRKAQDQPIRVLEIGCGHSLPGVYCMMRGCIVDYQDFNEEVIKLVTIPNVFINYNSLENRSSITIGRFFAGDWNSLLGKIPKQEYDVIITTETVYEANNNTHLYNLIRHSLSSTGFALVGAKTYYFGVGGGTRQFEDMVRLEGSMRFSTAKKIQDGASNIREVIRFDWVNKNNS